MLRFANALAWGTGGGVGEGGPEAAVKSVRLRNVHEALTPPGGSVCCCLCGCVCVRGGEGLCRGTGSGVLGWWGWCVSTALACGKAGQSARGVHAFAASAWPTESRNTGELLISGCGLLVLPAAAVACCCRFWRPCVPC